MYGRSDRFDNAVINGGVVTSKMQVLTAGVVVAELSPTDADMPAALTEGEVTVDVTATARRRYRAKIADPLGAWVPSQVNDLLSIVAGNEVKLFRGWRYPDGSEELLSLGIFDVDEPAVDDATTGLSIELSGQDRTRAVREDVWTKAYVVTKNQPVIAAAQAIIRSALPSVMFRGLSVNSVPHLTPYLTYDEKADRWDAAAQVLASAGLQAHFDVDGFCVIQFTPDLADAPVVWTYDDSQTSTMSRIQGSANRADVYNGVVAVGENTYGISPARAEVWDTDPASPTYAGTEASPGRFGRKAKFLDPNPAITTNAMASDAAFGELRRVRRVSTAYTLSLQPHAAHEGDDVVHVKRSKIGVDGIYVLERFGVPLSAKGSADTKMRLRV